MDFTLKLKEHSYLREKLSVFYLYRLLSMTCHNNTIDKTYEEDVLTVSSFMERALWSSDTMKMPCIGSAGEA